MQFFSQVGDDKVEYTDSVINGIREEWASFVVSFIYMWYFVSINNTLLTSFWHVKYNIFDNLFDMILFDDMYCFAIYDLCITDTIFIQFENW